MWCKHLTAALPPLLLMYLFFMGCHSLHLQSAILEGPSHRGPEDSLRLSCQNVLDNGDRVSMADIVPSPFTCHGFYVCRLKDITKNYTEPEAMDCPIGHGGTRLVYNFRNCTVGCGYKEETECYQEGNEDHINDFFKCAKVWDGSRGESDAS